MGCGENCGCAADNTSDEIVQAIDPSGKDVTAEVTGKTCSNENCQDGTCEKCSEEKSSHGDACCQVK